MTGDGASTLEQLIKAKNATRRGAGLPLLKPAPSVIKALTGAGSGRGGLEHILPRGKVTPIQDKANVSLGGEAFAVPVPR